VIVLEYTHTTKEITSELLDRIKIELPNRQFAAKAGKNENESIVYEIYENTLLNGKVFFVFDNERKTIRINKNFNDKKDRFFARYIANEVSLLFGLEQNAGYITSLVFNLNNTSEIDDITFVLRKMKEFLRALENIEGFGFSFVAHCDKMDCHYKGVCFRMKYLFNKDNIKIYLKFPLKNNSYSTTFEQKANFFLDFDSISSFSSNLLAEIKKIKIKAIFNNVTEDFSFVKKGINSRIIYKYTRDDSAYNNLSNFLKTELNITNEGLENLYLFSTESEHQKYHS
jgi:hypothetical protein